LREERWTGEVSVLVSVDDFLDARVDKSDRAVVARRECEINFFRRRITIVSLDEAVYLSVKMTTFARLVREAVVIEPSGASVIAKA
jgi:hypothetical protein